VPRMKNQIAGMTLSLEEGQEWTDTVQLTMTREQAHLFLASASTMMRQIAEGIEDAMKAADDGDLMAILVGPHLVQSYKDLQGAMREVTSQILPGLWTELMAQEAAEEAEAGAKVN